MSFSASTYGKLKAEQSVRSRAQRLIGALREGQPPPTLMSSPPTVSEGAGAPGNSRLTGGGYTSGFDLNGQWVRPLGGGFPALLSGASYFGGGVGFGTNSDAFEFYCRSGNYTVLVRNPVTRQWEKITSSEYSTSTGDKIQLVDFGSFADREIQIRSGAVSQMAGIKVRPTYDVWPIKRRPRVMVFGDSYTEYKSTISPELPLGGYAMRMGLYAGWDVIPAGVGGTGYTASASGRYRTRYPQISTYVADLDAIMLTGGFNDSGATDAAMTLAVLEDIITVRGLAPNIPIIVTAPFASSDVVDTKPAAVALAVTQAVAAGVANVYYMDGVAKRFLTGSDRTNAVKSGFVTFTGALVAATAGTLNANFGGPTGSYTLYFDDGTTKTATLTNGSTAVSWTGAVTASARVFYAQSIPTIAGNFGRFRDSGSHMSQAGHDGQGLRYAEGVADILYDLAV